MDNSIIGKHKFGLVDTNMSSYRQIKTHRQNIKLI